MQPQFIPLPNNLFAIVDAEDYERVSPFRWRAYIRRGRVNSVIRDRQPDNPHIVLSRFIMDAPVGVIVDHIDRNVLDCRKENLRNVTRQQNAQNSIARRGGISRYKGVSPCRLRAFPEVHWQAAIALDGTRRLIGYFCLEQDAAEAWDETARLYHGEYGRYNFPNPGERSAVLDSE